MKRLIVIAALLIALGVAAVFYFQIGVSAETKRDRSLEKARTFVAAAKVNEAIIEFKNALKADPRSAEAHHELGMALLKKGDFRAAYSEFVRAVDLKPSLVPARFQHPRTALRQLPCRARRQSGLDPTARAHPHPDLEPDLRAVPYRADAPVEGHGPGGCAVMGAPSEFPPGPARFIRPDAGVAG